jgi:NitT/TauT family transport system substrate-binding protein
MIARLGGNAGSFAFRPARGAALTKGNCELMNRLTALRVTAGGLTLIAGVPLPTDAQTAMLHIGAGTNDSFGEGHYLRDGGFLERVGLSAEVSGLGNGGELTAALVAGTLDATVTNVASIAAAHIHGLPLVVIAGSAVYRASDPPTTALLVLKDSQIRGAKDLIGKTVGLSTLHDLQQAGMMTWLDKSGVNSALVNFTEITNTMQFEALKQRRIDAVVSVEPWLTGSLGEARIVTKPYDSLASHLITTAWIANTGWVEKNPEITRKLVAAINATADWANKNKAATAGILQKYVALSPETLRTMNRLTFADRLDAGAMQPIIDASARYGFLPKTFPAGELFLGR